MWRWIPHWSDPHEKPDLALHPGLAEQQLEPKGTTLGTLPLGQAETAGTAWRRGGVAAGQRVDLGL